jgi:exopolysaccharide biosynthesis predicted pyruvyltransferase EpsI
MTLRSDKCFAELAQSLLEFGKHRSLIEIENTGNWGDALIHAGQREFFRDKRIIVERHSIAKLRKLNPFQLFSLSRFCTRRAVISGGGPWCDWYTRPLEMKRVSRYFSRILIMPSSYTCSPALNSNRAEFWRRDNSESAETVPTSAFCHDLAFYLSPKKRFPKQKLALMFRDDIERGEFNLPFGNRDISSEGTHRSSPDDFFDRIGEYEIIVTNRLHVGIAGALLGREVHLFKSRSKKIASVYEASLKPHYERVYYHADASGAEIVSQL